MTTKDYYRAMIFGGITAAIFIGLFYMLGVAVDIKESQSEIKLEQRFEIVDSYNDCNVVKWNGKGQYAEYKFFLDCPTRVHIVKTHEK